MKGRHDEGLRSLERLRPESHRLNGRTIAEAEALTAALEEGPQKSRWVDLLYGDWPKRVFVSALLKSARKTSSRM